MQTAIIPVEKKSTNRLETKHKNTKKQLQTSASRGSYIKNVKKKSNKTYRSSTLITSDTESEPQHSHFN